MASDGKKVPALGILIGMGKKPHGMMNDDDSSESMDSGDDEYSEELSDVADELADAILSKDKDAIVSALKSFKACK
ncbi:MAG TPA: hypothetical protein PLG27_00095 [Candidatus Latescibacteria bacterium]|nr:hypothetical protein [Candidatus Latescibacterota bacterium]